jgi:hypothetical protein
MLLLLLSKHRQDSPDFLFLSLFTLYVGGNILPVLSAKESGRSTKGH